MKVPSGLMVTSPFTGSTTGVVLMANSSSLGSESFGNTSSVIGVSSVVTKPSSLAIGGSLPGALSLRVMVTTAVSQSTGLPSSQIT